MLGKSSICPQCDNVCLSCPPCLLTEVPDRRPDPTFEDFRLLSFASYEASLVVARIYNPALL